MRVRFAPSPTGHLHVGNARTALFNWLLARGQGGTFILRIEDTDAERSTRESEAAILRDLRWLGLDWDEGPDIGGAHGPYRQSERLHLYQSYAKELLAAIAAYYCFCSPSSSRRSAQAARTRATGAVRWHLPAAVEAKQARRACRRRAAGDPLPRAGGSRRRRSTTSCAATSGFTPTSSAIRSSSAADGTPAYNFAVVIDDALMEITHVVRGEDHISNTPRQILLYEALGFTPPVFAHLALVLGPDHSPLSKRHGATSVAEFRAEGLSARSAGQLPRADRLVAAGRRQRRRAAAGRRARAPVLARAGRPQRRRVRRGEAGVGQPALFEDGRSGCGSPSCAAVFQAGRRAR